MGCKPYSRVLSVPRSFPDYFLEEMKPLSREHLAGHVVVTIANVSQSRNSLASLEPCLDNRDRQRAARFHFPEDRARFVLGRGLLRKYLGHYSQKAAEAIELAYTDRDRPIFPEDETIQFSISHTHDLVALAMTAHSQVGIDLEYMEVQSELIDLAKRILSRKDFEKFQVLPKDEMKTAFFRVWTRKEAYLKARGEGITEGLHLISVSFGPEETSMITDERDESGERLWRLINLPVPANYQGCVACDDPRKTVECNYVHFEKDEIIRDSLSSLG